MTHEYLPDQPTGVRLDRAKELLRAAMDLEGGQVADWVLEQTRDDEALGAYVLQLLGAARSEESSFRAVRETATDFVESQQPKQIGRYRILETLGQGGMGTVYLAEQTEPVRRQVALKLVKLGMDSQAVVARFEHERQSLALMEHDGIAKVHDCGTSDRGQPFFVMELVRGTPVSEYCDRKQSSVPERIRLMQQICDAVQHAHQKGVVHRDLKPSNVLVVEGDGRVQIKVIDFGLAKAMTSELAETPLLTEAGQILGTFEYMAPEQADPSNVDIDTRADVYSLGVMLYELLVGSLPFAGTELRRIGLLELQRVMRDVEPPRPSRRLSSMSHDEQSLVAEQRHSQTSTLMSVLRRDLDWVVARALAKDRGQRYESASALAADLQRFLDHEPLQAGPPSASYRLRKLVRRYRSQVSAVAAILLTALIGAGVAVGFAVEALDLADEKSQLALAEAAAKVAATTNAELLADKVREFHLLSGVVLHERCLEHVADLQPAWPDRLAAMQNWRDVEVGALVAMLPEIEATLASLRKRALPRTEQQLEELRAQHERYADLQKLRGWIDADRRSAAVRAGGELFIPEVPADIAKNSADDLWRMAVARIAPQFEQRTVLQEIELGLALARLAAERAKGTDAESNATDLLAWAYFANGQDGEALEVADRAVAEAAVAQRQKSEQRRSELQKAISLVASEHAARQDLLPELLAEIDLSLPRDFELPAHRFLYNALLRLQLDIEDLRSTELSFVQRRIAWAQQVAALTRAHPNARVTWDEARAHIATADDVVASRRYTGQAIDLAEDQCIGLVPIGMNPVTKLWEFYHLASAWDGESDPRELVIPEHGEDGSIDVVDDTGIVFVLVPGGEFVMGAQSEEPTGRNFDPEAAWYVGPPHQVQLDAFFLARHELTQGQWARMRQGDEQSRWPSQYKAGVYLKTLDEHITAVHPVDKVDWIRGREVLREHGLLLPTEAQWEYACRAGTVTPFFCAPEDVRWYANLADAKARRSNAEWAAFEEWDDGYVVTAPVGSMRANPWGFYDIAGNVLEWCEDGLGDYRWPVRAGDGLRQEQDRLRRVIRGGCMINRATFARSSMRTPADNTERLGHIGVRAARSLRPLQTGQ